MGEKNGLKEARNSCLTMPSIGLKLTQQSRPEGSIEKINSVKIRRLSSLSQFSHYPPQGLWPSLCISKKLEYLFSKVYCNTNLP